MMFSTNLLATAVLLAGAATATTHEAGMKAGSASAASAVASATRSGMMAAGTGTAGAGGEKVHVVQVGQNNALKFEPNNVKAAVGDLVQFQFWPKNHSVVQAAFANPCTPIQNVMSNVSNPFFSGFMPTTRNATAGQGSGALVYTVRVTSTAPMWYYCSQMKHCQGGMVGAINSPESADKSVAAFTEKAKAATENLTPGQMGGAAGGAGGAAGGNSTGLGSAQPSGGAGGAGGAGSTLATAAGGATATPSAPTNAPAQQSTNSSPDRLVENAMTGVAGIFGAAVAFFLL